MAHLSLFSFRVSSQSAGQTANLFLFSMAIFLCAMLSTPAQATDYYYKWQDKAGNTHYGERPPEGVNAKIVMRNNKKNKHGANATNQSPPKQPVQRPEDQTTSPMEEANKSYEEEVEKARAINCKNARTVVKDLSNFGRVREQMPDGTFRFLSPAEQQSRLGEARKIMQENCGS